MYGTSLHQPKMDRVQMRAVEFCLDEKLSNGALTDRKLLPADWDGHRRKSLGNYLKHTKYFHVVGVNFDQIMSV